MITDNVNALTRPQPATPVASLHIAALISFLAISFGWSWVLWGIAAVSAARVPWLTTVLFIVSGFGTSLAGLITVWVYQGKAGLHHWLARCLSWRQHPGWYLLAFLGPAAAMIAALGIDIALRGTLSQSPAAGYTGSTLLQFGLILIIGGPMGEEFGWRGYALPALSARMGWRWASLIVGAVWGAWHLPLFFIPGMAQAQMPMALFMASSVALSVVMARMALNTRFSVLTALLFHWAINGWSAVLPMIPQGGSVRPYVLVMSILFAIAVAVFLKPGPNPSQGSLPK